MTDMVNSPSHYKGNKFEVIDIIEDYKLGFNLANSIKYVLRAGRKDPSKTVEDLKKSLYYIQREIDNLSKEEAKQLVLNFGGKFENS